MEQRERERVAEVAKLKEALERADNKILVLKAESLELWAEKEAVEANLDKTFKDILVMLGQSFDHVVRQAHILYNGAPLFGNFDPNMDLFSNRVGALRTIGTIPLLSWSVGFYFNSYPSKFLPSLYLFHLPVFS